LKTTTQKGADLNIHKPEYVLNRSGIKIPN